MSCLTLLKKIKDVRERYKELNLTENTLQFAQELRDVIIAGNGTEYANKIMKGLGNSTRDDDTMIAFLTDDNHKTVKDFLQNASDYDLYSTGRKLQHITRYLASASKSKEVLGVLSEETSILRNTYNFFYNYTHGRSDKGDGDHLGFLRRLALAEVVFKFNGKRYEVMTDRNASFQGSPETTSIKIILESNPNIARVHLTNYYNHVSATISNHIKKHQHVTNGEIRSGESYVPFTKETASEYIGFADYRKYAGNNKNIGEAETYAYREFKKTFINDHEHWFGAMNPEDTDVITKKAWEVITGTENERVKDVSLIQKLQKANDGLTSEQRQNNKYSTVNDVLESDWQMLTSEADPNVKFIPYKVALSKIFTNVLALANMTDGTSISSTGDDKMIIREIKERFGADSNPSKAFQFRSFYVPAKSSTEVFDEIFYSSHSKNKLSAPPALLEARDTYFDNDNPDFLGSIANDISAISAWTVSRTELLSAYAIYAIDEKSRYDNSNYFNYMNNNPYARESLIHFANTMYDVYNGEDKKHYITEPIGLDKAMDYITDIGKRAAGMVASLYAAKILYASGPTNMTAGIVTGSATFGLLNQLPILPFADNDRKSYDKAFKMADTSYQHKVANIVRDYFRENLFTTKETQMFTEHRKYDQKKIYEELDKRNFSINKLMQNVSDLEFKVFGKKVNSGIQLSETAVNNFVNWSMSNFFFKKETSFAFNNSESWLFKMGEAVSYSMAVKAVEMNMKHKNMNSIEDRLLKKMVTSVLDNDKNYIYMQLKDAYGDFSPYAKPFSAWLRLREAKNIVDVGIGFTTLGLLMFKQVLPVNMNFINKAVNSISPTLSGALEPKSSMDIAGSKVAYQGAIGTAMASLFYNVGRGIMDHLDATSEENEDKIAEEKLNYIPQIVENTMPFQDYRAIANFFILSAKALNEGRFSNSKEVSIVTNGLSYFAGPIMSDLFVSNPFEASLAHTKIKQETGVGSPLSIVLKKTLIDMDPNYSPAMEVFNGITQGWDNTNPYDNGTYKISKGLRNLSVVGSTNDISKILLQYTIPTMKHLWKAWGVPAFIEDQETPNDAIKNVEKAALTQMEQMSWALKFLPYLHKTFYEKADPILYYVNEFTQDDKYNQDYYRKVRSIYNKYKGVNYEDRDRELKEAREMRMAISNNNRANTKLHYQAQRDMINEYDRKASAQSPKSKNYPSRGEVRP